MAVLPKMNLSHSFSNFRGMRKIKTMSIILLMKLNLQNLKNCPLC